MKKIETERLTMEIMSVHELLALAEEYRLSDPELCEAYREMAQVYSVGAGTGRSARRRGKAPRPATSPKRNAR